MALLERLQAAAVSREAAGQDALYGDAARAFGGAVERLARGYEADEARRQDLVQEIHVALWRSFGGYDARCSLRTWVYRVAHNVAATHVLRARRGARDLVGLDALHEHPDPVGVDQVVERRDALKRLLGLVRSLTPLDRQVILLYLEGEDAATIAEVTGLSAVNVATKVHRLKKVLTDRFRGGSHA